MINKSGNASFDLATFDSLGIRPCRLLLELFNALMTYQPLHPTGIARVQGDQTNDFDDYYVKFRRQQHADGSI